jgi:NADPH-dependent curcumin reductase CurA
MGLRYSLFATNVLVFSLDYAAEFPAAIQELATGLIDGSIKRKFHMIEGGVEQAPVALPLLFSGGNTGKL